MYKKDRHAFSRKGSRCAVETLHVWLGKATDGFVVEQERKDEGLATVRWRRVSRKYRVIYLSLIHI